MTLVSVVLMAGQVMAAGQITKAVNYDSMTEWRVEASSPGMNPDIDEGETVEESGGGFAYITGGLPDRTCMSSMSAYRGTSHETRTARNDLSIVAYATHDIWPGTNATTTAESKLQTSETYRLFLKEQFEKVYWRIKFKAKWTREAGPETGPAGTDLSFMIMNGERWLTVTWQPNNNRWAFYRYWDNTTEYSVGFDVDKTFSGNYPSGPTFIVDLDVMSQNRLGAVLHTIGSNNPGHPGENNRVDKCEIWIENRITDLQ